MSWTGPGNEAKTNTVQSWSVSWWKDPTVVYQLQSYARIGGLGMRLVCHMTMPNFCIRLKPFLFQILDIWAVRIAIKWQYLYTKGYTALTKMIHGATPDKVECGFTSNYVLTDKVSQFLGSLRLGHACVTLIYVTQLLQASRVCLEMFLWLDQRIVSCLFVTVSRCYVTIT